MIVDDFLAGCVEFNDYPADIVYGDAEPSGFKYVGTVSMGTNRWFEIMWTVFERDGQFVAVDWESGLTEYQDNEINIDKWHVQEVQPYEQIVTRYKRVPVPDVA